VSKTLSSIRKDQCTDSNSAHDGVESPKEYKRFDLYQETPAINWWNSNVQTSSVFKDGPVTARFSVRLIIFG